MVAAQAGGETEPEPDAPAAEAPNRRRPRPLPKPMSTPEFDLSSLPKLEELTAATDITAFLRKGVPEHLRNAALRKSWALDPAIRNYVNPALDYAYDWNTPGGVPGSSETRRRHGCRAAGFADHGRRDRAGESPSPRRSSEDEAASDPAQSARTRCRAKPQADLPDAVRRRLSERDGRIAREPQRPSDMRRSRDGRAFRSEPILLHRNSRCDAMAPQNRLFRQKFLTDIGNAYVTDFTLE